jgi:hypothetical protein
MLVANSPDRRGAVRHHEEQFTQDNQSHLKDFIGHE